MYSIGFGICCNNSQEDPHVFGFFGVFKSITTWTFVPSNITIKMIYCIFSHLWWRSPIRHQYRDKHMCHNMCHEKDPEMFKYLSCARKYIWYLLVFMLDGFISALVFQARTGFRHLCWDKPISHSNQYHMHILFIVNHRSCVMLIKVQ